MLATEPYSIEWLSAILTPFLALDSFGSIYLLLKDALTRLILFGRVWFSLIVLVLFGYMALERM